MKKYLRIAACAVAASLLAQPAMAQADNYPNKIVKIVVPFGAGSLTDLLARTLSEKLGTAWKQSVIVENHPGIAGTALAAKAAPDGYTLMITSNGHTIIKLVNPNVPFDPVGDFTGVTKLASMPMIMLTPPDSKHESLKNLIEHAKETPGKLSFASAGLASTAYIAGALFNKTQNMNVVHVPYKGTPDAQTSIMRGDTDFFFSPASLSDDLIKTNKVRAVAVTGTERVGSLPDVPTFKEAGVPEFEYDAWFGMLAPKGTPKDILEKISKDVAAAMSQPDVKERLAKQGTTVSTSTPDEFSATLRNDTATFSEALKQ
jgi:tripartite-type tricarboxylate transporter receptor subunit TctC